MSYNGPDSRLHSEQPIDTSSLEVVRKLTKDIRESGKLLTVPEVRFLVNHYYMMQDLRKGMGRRVQLLAEAGKPNSMVEFYYNQYEAIEATIKRALESWLRASEHPVVKWMLTIYGIGPVIASGFFSEINIHRAHVAASIWRYAGLDPTVKWEKGQTRPYNSYVKRMAYYTEESFVKQGNFYRMIYDDRYAYMSRRNDDGHYADMAKFYFERFKWGPETEPAKEAMKGRLAKSAIHALSKRYAVKLFLAHFYQIYREAENLPVARPYAIEHLGHAHVIYPPMDDNKVIYCEMRKHRANNKSAKE